MPAKKRSNKHSAASILRSYFWQVNEVPPLEQQPSIAPSFITPSYCGRIRMVLETRKRLLGGKGMGSPSNTGMSISNNSRGVTVPKFARNAKSTPPGDISPLICYCDTTFPRITLETTIEGSSLSPFPPPVQQCRQSNAGQHNQAAGLRNNFTCHAEP